MPTEVAIQGSTINYPQTPRLAQTIQTRAEAHFRALGLIEPELSVVLCDNPTIHALNRTWRDEDKPTDVLSFPLHEFSEPGEFLLPPGYPAENLALGDVIISVEYAHGLVATREHHQRVAQDLGVDPATFDWTLADEVHFLLIHGLLHLIGHDHLDPQEERRMRAEERRLWESIDQY